MMENAVGHGYRMATEKGYAEKRERDRRKAARRVVPARTGVVNVAGWRKLAAMFPGSVQAGGSRLVN